MSVKRRQVKSFGIQSGLDSRAASSEKSKFSLEKKLKMQIKKVTSKAAILKLIEDRLKAVRDKDINALLSNHTLDIRWRSLSVSAKRRRCQRGASALAERESFNVIDPLPYIGADTVIARNMDDIITFTSPRN
jgi:hypothetical protein